MTRSEIKQHIREELRCPADFIERCLKRAGRIDQLKEAESEVDTKIVMHAIHEEYANYCKVWDLDMKENNTAFKPTLWR